MGSHRSLGLRHWLASLAALAVVAGLFAADLIVAQPAAASNPADTKITLTSSIGDPDRGDTGNAIDGDLSSFAYTTPGFTSGTAYFEVGFDSTTVNRLRIWKSPDQGGPQDEVIQYTTGTEGDLRDRAWTTVTGLANGFQGDELLHADAVNSDGTISVDLHDSDRGDGWGSLTFDPVTATGIRVQFARSDHDAGCCTHYQVNEFEVHHSTATPISLTSVPFSFTGASQSWVVPDGVGRVQVDALGAKGGDVFGGGFPGRNGGLGGEAVASVPVTPGESLQINVGGAGGECHSTAGGFNGGGNGIISFPTCGGGGGGGASDIRQGGTFDLADRVVVAGGGGGSANINSGDCCHADGGGGGGLTGDDGVAADGGPGGAGGGQTLTTGSETYGQGGDGGGTNGAGGGGGYVGGDGGGSAGGGGGSGFGPAGTVFTNGVQNGDGQVTISYASPAITSAATTNFPVGAPGSFAVTTTGTPAATLSAAGVPLPSGVTFTDNGDGTGTLAGTPDGATEGTYPISITASNDVGADDVQNFTLTVDDGPGFTSANNTTFVTESAGLFTVTTVGAPTPTLSETGALPNGVSLTDNGDNSATLAGTPDAGTEGSYPITITASNGVGADATQNFTFEVNAPPAITSDDNTPFEADAAGTFTVTTTGRPAPALSEIGALPTDVTFTDNGDGTATIAGTPPSSSIGSYPITITAANGVGTDAMQSFTLTVQDTTAPNTQIDSQPSDPTTETTADFTFSSPDGGVTFTCTLDSGTPESCDSGSKSYPSLPDGSHTFEVFATDAATNADTSPATLTWTVDTTGPTVTIDDPSPADGSTTGPSPEFSFSTTAADQDHFICTLDSTTVDNACTSPKSYSSLPGGSHHIEVYGVDSLGNSGSPVARDFTVDATGPTVTITGPTRTFARRPRFTFTTGDAVSVTCTLDGAPVACTLTGFQPATRLRFGSHTLTVVGTDQYGNQGPTATKVFKVRRRRR